MQGKVINSYADIALFMENVCRKPEFPLLGICDDWRLEFSPFVELPTIRTTGFQEHWLKKLMVGISEEEIADLMRMVNRLLEDYSESTGEESQAIGHEIVFFACIYRRAVWGMIEGAPPESAEQHTSLWKWSLWEPIAHTDGDFCIAHGWTTGEERRLGYVDRYVQTRANPLDLNENEKALLSATSEFIWSIFRATNAIQESIDAAADCQKDVVGTPAWKAGLAKAVVGSLGPRSLVTQREHDRVCSDTSLATSYAIDLDNEFRAIRATCCLVGRVVSLSVGHATGRGPFVPHRGVIFDGPVPSAADANGLKRVARESFDALCRVGADQSSGLSTTNRMDDANAMVVAATVMASHFKSFAHIQTCVGIVAACANRFAKNTK